MKLLLDEHYSPEIARRLREEGFDVVSVAERSELVSVGDAELFAVAAYERRALLTNNVRDFVALARRWATIGQDHYGLIFTADASLPRSRATIGKFIRRLRKLLETNSAQGAFGNRIHWL